MGDGGEDGGGPAGTMPPIDFTTFVLSMSHACMIHLGDVEGGDVDGGEGAGRAPNLPMACQTIDILEMLERKTEGNLDGEEERILAQVLADLRAACAAKGA